MKTFISILFLFISIYSYSQERVNISMEANPINLTVGTSIELELNWFYAKVGLTTKQSSYSYSDIHGVIGINYHQGYFDTTRYYAGLRLGRIVRGSNQSYQELVGLETGLDLKLLEGLYLGPLISYDLNNSVQDKTYRLNTSIKISFVIGTLSK